MRYDEIKRHVREHLSASLRRLEGGVAETGPLDALRVDALRATQGLTEADAADWAGMVHPEGAAGLLRAFCALRGIPEGDLTPASRVLMLNELRNGHFAYAAAALEHNAGLTAIDLRDSAFAAFEAELEASAPATPYRDVLEEYFREVEQHGALAIRTLSAKRTALDLLGEITGGKPLAELTKADARTVKQALGRLPKNRSKLRQTRGKPLADILDLPGVEVIFSKTVNEYIVQMASLMVWAVELPPISTGQSGMTMKGSSLCLRTCSCPTTISAGSR